MLDEHRARVTGSAGGWMWSATGRSQECLEGSWQVEGGIRELHGTQAGARGAGLSRREVRGLPDTRAGVLRKQADLCEGLRSTR